MTKSGAPDLNNEITVGEKGEPSTYMCESEMWFEDKLLTASDPREDRFKSTTKLREYSTYITFFIVMGWLTIMSIVILSQEKLSDKVLIVALTTTTINILGLPLIILSGLFNKKQKAVNKNKSSRKKRQKDKSKKGSKE